MQYGDHEHESVEQQVLSIHTLVFTFLCIEPWIVKTCLAVIQIVEDLGHAELVQVINDEHQRAVQQIHLNHIFGLALNS